jgi:hypothetical protein
MKTLLFSLALVVAGHAASPILKRSDVVFMYQADRRTYDAYGATVLAWGGRPSPKSLDEAAGVKFFGSVGMVTEFARYHDRFSESYEEGLCRDVFGNPVKVPWLTDHHHKGIPYWWCCTQQPQFRQYLRERVADTLRAGAFGIHVDDHMGSAGGLWLGLCFCERCVKGFQAHLAGLPKADLARFGIEAPESYDFRMAMRTWMAADANAKREPPHHPLWGHWTVYQCRAAAAFMEELHSLASETAGRKVPMGANAGLLWPRHLSDYKTLDLFSAETDHHAGERKPSDLPMFAYRMADAVERPYAATASGGDWAFINEQNLPGLVRHWIALSYAAGHVFMAPHRQWCYTPDKGTHWYSGPEEQFAPLYQFVRKNPGLFDSFETFADVAVLLPHRAFLRNPARWFEIGQELGSANLAYRLILAGDELVDVPIDEQLLFQSPLIVACDRDDLLEQDHGWFDRRREGSAIFGSAREAVQSIRPGVRVSSADVRLLPRTKPGGAAIHLLNRRYAPDTDQFQPLTNLQVSIDRAALGLPATAAFTYFQPGAEPVRLKCEGEQVEIPVLQLWGILLVE